MGDWDNPHKISKMHTTIPAESTSVHNAIRDDLDFPHAGLFRAMGQYAKGCFAIKAAVTDFDITLADGGTYSSVAVAAGKVFVHNKYVAVSALSAELLDTSYDDGGGGTAADLTPLTGTYVYLMIVYDPEDSAIRIRGSSNSGHKNYSGGKIPYFMDNAGKDTPDDVPIAILRLPDDGDDDGFAAIAVQYLTTSLSENSVEIGFPTGSAPNKLYNKAMSITSDADGDVTIENFADDKDVIFKVSDGGVSTEVMRLDASTGFVTIGGETTGEGPLHVRHSGSGHTIIAESTDADDSHAPDLVLFRFSATPADADDLGIIKFRGRNDNSQSVDYAMIKAEATDVSDTTEDGQLIFYIKVNGSDVHAINIDTQGATADQPEIVINESQINMDFRVESDTNAYALFVDASEDGVSIGGSANDANAKLTVQGSISLDEVSAPTATTGYGKLWTQTDNNAYFQDGAGTNTVLLKGGKHTIWVPAASMYPETTNGCSDLTQVELGNGPELKCLDFADGADDHAQFTISFPKSWNEGTITFEPFWTVTGTNTGTVAWGLAGTCFANDATINTAFSSPVVTVALAHSGTSNDLMKSAVSGNVTVQNAAVDTLCVFQIMRDISADTQSGAARLLGIKLYYTLDSGNDS
jgi:hypothetical protein